MDIPSAMSEQTPSTGQPVPDRKSVDMATPAEAGGKETSEKQEVSTDEATTASTNISKDTGESAAAADKPAQSSPATAKISEEQQPSEAHDQPAKPSGEEKEAKQETVATTAKPEHTDTSPNNIQEGYVLVAHPDAALPGPSSGTINSSGSNGMNNNNKEDIADKADHATTNLATEEPLLQDHIDEGNNHQNESEHGQEVEHYDPNTPPARIQAYARLEFPFFNFYIQKLSVTIGRRPPVSRGASAAPNKLLAQAGGEAGSALEVPPHDKSAAIVGNEGREAEQPKEATEKEKPSPKAEESKDNDAEIAFKVKKEEEDKDEQPSGEPREGAEPSTNAPTEHTVKAEETPRKASAWIDQRQGDDVAGPSGTSTSGAAGASDASPGVPAARTSVEPSSAQQAQSAAVEAGQSQTQAQAQQNQAAETSNKSDKNQVDVDLGPIKAVSRQHARLFFDDTINPKSGLTNSWSLEVKGRNGLVLDGKWRAKGEIARLRNG